MGFFARIKRGYEKVKEIKKNYDIKQIEKEKQRQEYLLEEKKELAKVKAERAGNIEKETKYVKAQAAYFEAVRKRKEAFEKAQPKPKPFFMNMNLSQPTQKQQEKKKQRGNPLGKWRVL